MINVTFFSLLASFFSLYLDIINIVIGDAIYLWKCQINVVAVHVVVKNGAFTALKEMQSSKLFI